MESVSFVRQAGMGLVGTLVIALQERAPILVVVEFQDYLAMAAMVAALTSSAIASIELALVRQGAVVKRHTEA